MLEYWPNSRASPRPCIHAIPNLVAYELLTRWSELVALTSDDLELLADGTMRVIIRRSKSDPFGQGRIAFTSKRTADAVTAWLNWRGTGIDAFSGHSLRVGAAQDLFCAGYGTAVIMRAGGRKSVNILMPHLEMAEQNMWTADRPSGGHRMASL